MRWTISVLMYVHASALLSGAPALKPGSVTVGRNLQTYTTVALSEPAPADLQLTITSADPSRLLLSKTPDVAGSASITITVRNRFRESPEYWLHGLADSGQVAYTVSAPGIEPATGLVTLTPSGIIVTGPLGKGAPEFLTTPRGWPTRISFRTARLDASLKPVERQFLRGGFGVDLKLINSDPAVGSLASQVRIDGGMDHAAAEFRPAGIGKTKLTITPPPDFSTPADLSSITAIVKMPGLSAAMDMTIGENLQLPATLNLGEPAPEGGVVVKITSSDPNKLLLSTSATAKGSASINISMPAGSVSTTYYLQALASEGVVTNTAVASGYTSRTGTLRLAPSGVILSLPGHGPPDEAELFRPASAGGKQNLFVALLSERRDTPLVLYTAFMDPVTKRTADITVQALRAGLTAHVKLENSNPDVGTVDPHVTIQGGAERTLLSFKPLKAGQTVISVVTPDGFGTPSNATELLGIVRE